MSGERTRVVWIEERTDYTVDELVSLSGLPPHVVDELIECGVLPTVAADRRVFASECVTLVRAARRLRDDFELEDQGLALVVSLLRRVRAQESELLGYRAPPPPSST
jgi:chaperone modulatory protein CbpM